MLIITTTPAAATGKIRLERRPFVESGVGMADQGPADDPAMTDVAWRGYDGRALLPAVAVAAAASVVLLSGRWYLAELSWLADRAGALAVFGLAVAVWPGLIAVLLYRAVTYTYRLTDRAVLVDRGFLARPEPPVWLAEVTAVEAGAGGVG